MPSIGPVAVIGLGTFGATIALDLAAFGHHVIGVDIDERRVNDLSDALAQAVIADARDERALREVGVDQCDAAVIAVGEDLEANIVGAMNVRTLGVPQVWSKSRSQTHRRILSAIGVQHVVNPERDMGHRVAQTIHNPFVTDYMVAGDGQSVVSFTAPERLIGRPFDRADWFARYAVHPLGLLRDGTPIPLAGGPAIEPGDVLLLLGARTDLQRFAEKQCA